MRLNPALLRSRGWELPEIEHASQVIERAEGRKHATVIILDHSIYWFLLLVAMAGNVAAAFFLLPILAFLPGTAAYVIIGIVALCLGALFTIIIRDIEKAGTKHHVLAAVLIPVAAIVTFIVMAGVANTHGLRQANHSVVGVGITYAIFFLLPYLFFLSEERFEFFEPKGKAGTSGSDDLGRR
jgi:hypothetical protein